MTNEEMAIKLEYDAEKFSKYDQQLRESLLAGAAALRAGEWKPIADAPEVIEHGALWGHRYPDGRFHSDTLTHRDTAMRLMHTHYRELPAPPEGV